MSTSDPPVPATAFWPSPYTAALLQTLRRHPEWVRDARVLEIGCGSGVLLAAAGRLGAGSLCGVDIEPAAVAVTLALLRELDLAVAVEVYQGDLFAPVHGRQFDLILANLPHFPMAPAPIGERLSTWSSGGADGRLLLDPFLAGLGDQLAVTGRAVIAHNAFIGLAATTLAAQRAGLAIEVTQSVLVDVPPTKLARLTPDVLKRESERSIFVYGELAFAEMLVLAITHSGAGRP